MPYFGKRSRTNLATCDERLRKVFNEVIKHVDCSVIEGNRNEARQNKLYAEGKTKVMKNKHISAYAQSKIDRLEQENIKLRIALCNLRDEYLDMGGNPNQLELFDEDDWLF